MGPDAQMPEHNLIFAQIVADSDQRLTRSYHILEWLHCQALLLKPCVNVLNLIRAHIKLSFVALDCLFRAIHPQIYVWALDIAGRYYPQLYFSFLVLVLVLTDPDNGDSKLTKIDIQL